MAKTNSIFGSMDAEDRIRKAKVQLSMHNAFLSHLILKLKVVEDGDKTDTMSTDGKNIYYNRDFVESLEQSQLFFVVKHELYHILFFHPFRIEHRNPGIFNIAADLIVNYKLIKKAYLDGYITTPGNPEMTEDVVRSMEDKCLFIDNAYFDFTPVEVLYDTLFIQYKAQKEQLDNLLNSMNVQYTHQERMEDDSSFSKTVKNQFGDTISRRANIGQSEVIEISHGVRVYQMVLKVSSSQIIYREMQCKFDVISAEAMEDKKELIDKILASNVAAKMYGYACYEQDVVIKDLYGPKLRWDHYLKRYFTLASDHETSFCNPDRKYICQELLLPGDSESDGDRIEDLFIIMDTSGSISTKYDLPRFLKQVKDICKSFEVTGKLIEFDDGITKITELATIMDFDHFTIRGRGDTDLIKVITYIRDQKMKYSLMVVLTDGCFEIPAQPVKNIVWVLNNMENE